ncbi:helix-turn-helix transcriptional regulator [Aestuariispira ectoiniformans]|uniref:helix-turn-helix transcriptional regulator n=1 Tax=Aestuariispira ectoiniformans TaxID=2775080 RepID=UPI00223BF466|nr:AraC family transcriptional regulator [Aestuariispira ectoiniformans]
MLTGIAQQEAVYEDGLQRQEMTRFWMDSRFDDLECLHARFTKYVYSPHTHDTYAFGTVICGTELYRSRGCENALNGGESTVINPGDLHDGRPAEGGYEYRMFYPSVALMRRALAEVTESDSEELPYFNNSHMADPEISSRIANLHVLLANGGDTLEAEEKMLEMLTLLIRRYADGKHEAKALGREGGAIQRVRNYVEDQLETDFHLEDLSGLVDMNQFRLIRSFKKETGQTPHAYVINRRIERAKRMMRAGATLAEVSVACGFYDQSHLNRAFKKTVGVTPKVYRDACLS